MPPLPKKKHSKGRQGGRKAHFGIKPMTLAGCPPQCPVPQCPTVRLPHRACHVCGDYNGRKVKASTSFD